jgi:protein TonB
MKRYNILNWGGPHPVQTKGWRAEVGTAGMRSGALSARRGGHVGFGIASAVLHVAAVGALTLIVARPPETASPDETQVEIVFQPADPPGTMAEPAAEPPPSPPLVPAATPETPSLETGIEPPLERPAPPPPKPIPAPVLKPPPKPKPKVTVKAPATRPAPVAKAAQRPLVPERGAPPGQGVPGFLSHGVPQQGIRERREQAPPKVAAPAVDQRWQASVANWLAARKIYPEEARRRGEEGRVAIRFTVDRSGRVVDAAITSSSGSTRLDAATLTLLRQASLPAFPPSMVLARVTITTTVRYALR